MFGIWELKDVKRSFKFWWQRKTRGWDDSDTWDLDYTIAKFTLPRLKRFKETTASYPGSLTEDKWNHILDDMIYAMEVCSACDDCSDYDCGRVNRGLRLFGKYFRNLWS